MNNIADGVGMLETIDAGVSAAQDIMQRMRELLVKGANGTNSLDERNILQTEFNELYQSLEDLSHDSRYLLKGRSILRISNIGMGPNPFRHPEINIQAGSNESDLLNLDLDADTVNDRGIYISPDEGMTGVEGTMQYGNNFVLINTYFGGTKETANGKTFNFRRPEDYLPDMDNMLKNLSRMRSELGAKINTLNSRFNYLDRYNQSLMEANSRIVDVDYAAESSRLLKSQIQSQAASAVLYQANNQASIVLSLIPGGR